MATTWTAASQPYRSAGATFLNAVSRSGRARAALFVVLAVPLLAVAVWRLMAGGAAGTPVTTPAAGGSAALTPGQVLPALERSLSAPNDVTLEVTYAPPLFFQVTGQPAPAGSALTLFLQEDTHIDALADMPPRFYLVVDGKGQFFPTEGGILSNSGHHRTSRFLFAPGSVPEARSSLAAIFLFEDGSKATAQWELPLQFAAAGEGAAASPAVGVDESLSSVELPSLNRVLRKV